MTTKITVNAETDILKKFKENAYIGFKEDKKPSDKNFSEHLREAMREYSERKGW